MFKSNNWSIRHFPSSPTHISPSFHPSLPPQPRWQIARVDKVPPPGPRPSFGGEEPSPSREGSARCTDIKDPKSLNPLRRDGSGKRELLYSTAEYDRRQITVPFSPLLPSAVFGCLRPCRLLPNNATIERSTFNPPPPHHSPPPLSFE